MLNPPLLIIKPHSNIDMPNSASIISKNISRTTSHELQNHKSSCPRLFLNTMILVFGASTIISIFVMIFLLNGLNMLTLSTAAISCGTAFIGVLLTSLGIFLIINQVDQSLAGILKRRLMSAEQELSALKTHYNLSSPSSPPDIRRNSV